MPLDGNRQTARARTGCDAKAAPSEVPFRAFRPGRLASCTTRRGRAVGARLSRRRSGTGAGRDGSLRGDPQGDLKTEVLLVGPVERLPVTNPQRVEGGVRGELR